MQTEIIFSYGHLKRHILISYMGVLELKWPLLKQILCAEDGIEWSKQMIKIWLARLFILLFRM